MNRRFDMIKEKVFIFIFGILICVSVFGQMNFYSKPWENKEFPIVIDAYGPNSIDMDKVKTDERVVAIIHQASRGLKADDKYLKRSKESEEKGLLYASYHIGTKEDDPIAQADFYLEVTKDNPNIRALDIEDNGGKYITLKNAEIFIQRIYDKTGVYPFVYLNNSVFQEINKNYDKSSIFAKCPLWYASYKGDISGLSTHVWDKVSLWQFCSEINCSKTGNCLYQVPGTLYDMDIDVFNGNKEALMDLFSQVKNK